MVTSMFEKTQGDFGSIFFCLLFTSVANIYTRRRYIKTPKQERKYVQITNTIFAYQNLQLANQGLPIKSYQLRLTNQGLPKRSCL